MRSQGGESAGVIISGVLFETVPGRANSVAARLAQIENLEITGTDGNHRLVAIWRGKDGSTLEQQAEKLLQSESEILGIYPTFVGKE
ncbi:MAG: chaperone NapD [Terriglobales bacterium]